MENVLNKFTEIFAKNPAFLSSEFIVKFTQKTFTHDILGVSSDNEMETNFKISGIEDEVKELKIVQILGLMNQYADSLFDQCFDRGIRKPELKSGKTYSLTLSVRPENIDTIAKSGFGLIFYNIGEMFAVVQELNFYLRRFFLEQSGLDVLQVQKLKQVIDNIHYGTSTNEAIVSYIKIFHPDLKLEG
jgi:hypothetical protein